MMNVPPKSINQIRSIEDIQELATQGCDNWLTYGEVNVTERGDLLLFDYTTAAHIANRWNFFERVSRGLIINQRTGEIVARPFDKFFYWLEGHKARGHIVTITEKLDGSLGILFRHKGEYHIATKGSFFSPQARWATAFLREHYDLADLPDELTLLFEIVYPDNRIIIDYGRREELILLAARNRFTGDYLSFFPGVYELSQQYGFPLPQVYSFNSIDDLIAETGKYHPNFEGWVVEFSDGQRFKFKMDEYIEIHQLVRGLDFPNVVKQVANGDISRVLDVVPDVFLGDVKQWVEQIQVAVADLKAQVNAVFATAPKDSKAAFTAWVATHHPTLQPYLQALFDGQPLEPVIYKHAFKDRAE
ncbi:MAG TPA: T4 RnlA family RNA ligase [Phototrophicaceae bacterium]|nr:T4 RnlA family RNA ligase [Phototrophicaceae bacterium]